MRVSFLEMPNVTRFTISISLKIELNVERHKGHVFGCLCFVGDWCVTLDNKFNGFSSFTLKEYHFVFFVRVLNIKLILTFRLMMFSHFMKKEKFLPPPP